MHPPGFNLRCDKIAGLIKLFISSSLLVLGYSNSTVYTLGNATEYQDPILWHPNNFFNKTRLKNRHGFFLKKFCLVSYTPFSCSFKECIRPTSPSPSSMPSHCCPTPSSFQCCLPCLLRVFLFLSASHSR